MVTTADALNTFFLVERNRRIETKEELIRMAELFCREHSAIQRVPFLEGIEAYARGQEMV